MTPGQHVLVAMLWLSRPDDFNTTTTTLSVERNSTLIGGTAVYSGQIADLIETAVTATIAGQKKSYLENYTAKRQSATE